MPTEELYTQKCDNTNETNCFYFGCPHLDTCERRKQIKDFQKTTPIEETQMVLWNQLRSWLQHERDMANDNRYYSHGSAFSSVLDRMFLLENNQNKHTNKVG